MDINTFRGLSTAFLLLAFIVFCFWAFSKNRKKDFSEAELLPFDDDTIKQIKKGSEGQQS